MLTTTNRTQSNGDGGQGLINYLRAKDDYDHNVREDTSRSWIAEYLTDAFVAVFFFILITGIGINFIILREEVDIFGLLTTTGSVFTPVLSFVLGYYFGKDKK